MLKNLLLALAVLLVCDVLFAQVVKRVLPTPLHIQQELERSYRVPDPIFHHTLAPNRAERGAWGDRVYPIFTNSLGFKDRAVREVPVQSDDYRILFIGDSFTEGTGVKYEDTFVGRLDVELAKRDVRVMNAAVVSYSPTIYYRKVKYLLEDVKLDFDELVVFIDISDIDDEAKYYALDASDRVVTATTAPAAPPPESGWRTFLKDNSVLIRVADFAKDTLIEGKGWNRVTGDQNELLRRLTDSDRCGWTYDPVKLEGYGRRGLERAMQHMDMLREVLRAHGNKPLTVVVYPWPAQLIKGDRDSIQARTWRDWCAKNGVQLIDLFPVFFAAGKPMDVVQADYIPWDNHFAEPGHAVVAQSFLERFVLGRDRAKTATTATSTATP